MSVLNRLRRPGAMITPDVGGGDDGGGAPEIALATVGTEEDDEPWARVEGRKAYVEVRLETGGSADDYTIAEAPIHVLGQLGIGSVVLLGFVNGDPNNAYIISLVHVLDDGIPDTVASIDTGASGAADIDTDDPPTAPLPLLYWLKTDAGRHLALESGEDADVVLHAGAGVEIKAASPVHVSAEMHVGYGFTTRPIARTAGAPILEDGEVAGAPGTPHVPTPHVNTTIPVYSGWAEGVVRAKDEIQSGFGTDSTFWTYMAALDVVVAAIGGAVPAAAGAVTTFQLVPKANTLTSRPVTASQALSAADAPPVEPDEP